MIPSTLLPIRRMVRICLIAACFLPLLSTNIFAQACGGLGVVDKVTSSGTEFLLVFMQNEAVNFDGTSTQYQDVYMASNADSADVVTITCRAFPNWNVKIPLAARGSAVYRLSTDPTIGMPKQDAIVETNELIDSTVFRVVSKYPITCYGMNNKHVTADAFLALPRNVSTTDYIVMSYFTSTQLGGDMNMPSEFAVASFENNNTVRITPSAVTRSGNPKGKEMIFVLDSGECVQIQTSPDSVLADLTGSTVRAQKPVVVYGGSARTEIPIGYSFNQATSRDHLCEAMPPQSTWGKSFIAKNLGRPLGDILRVLASDSNTTVKINGKVWGQPLTQYGFRDTLIPQRDDSAALNIVAVESDRPILVGLLAHTGDPDTKSGDPFLAIVTPLEQTYNDLTYFISNDAVNYNLSTQFVIIATEQSGVGTGRFSNISIDGSKLPTNLFTNVPFQLRGFNTAPKNWAVTTLQQTPGIHHITTPNPAENGVTILAYGFGQVISYGYTGAALLKPLYGIISLPSPTPGVAPGPGGPAPIPPPSINVRNIMAEKIYFDSAKITYSQNKDHIAVRLKKDISLETGTIEMAEEKTLELVTSEPVKEMIIGNVRIWYHSRLWMDLTPADFPFVITPQSQADVNTAEHQSVLLENYPNPAAGKTTVHFAIPERAHASVKIYDALGRVVRIVIQGMVNPGDQNIQVITKGMVPGDYTLELLAPELGISEHRKMIVIE